MSDNILPSQKIFSIKDARELSRKRLPKLVSVSYTHLTLPTILLV